MSWWRPFLGVRGLGSKTGAARSHSCKKKTQQRVGQHRFETFLSVCRDITMHFFLILVQLSIFPKWTDGNSSDASPFFNWTLSFVSHAFYIAIHI